MASRTADPNHAFAGERTVPGSVRETVTWSAIGPPLTVERIS